VVVTRPAVSGVVVVEEFTRVAPPLTERTAPFWTSGADGVLRIARCADCGRYRHPPRPVCPDCRGRGVAFEPVSGRGTVWSWTVNRYPWVPSMPPPYLVADIELAEQPGLRLLSNVVDCAPEAIYIGLPVEVCFSQAGDAYVPLFRPRDPRPDGPGTGHDDAPASGLRGPGLRGPGPQRLGPQRLGRRVPTRAAATSGAGTELERRVESRAAISGVGRSRIGRRLRIDPWVLTADAALAAIADAGLTPADIDGVSTYPGATWSTPGMTGAGVDDVRAMLGLRLRWHTGGGELAGQLGSVVNAVLAVGGGLANHVLCFRTVWESTAQDGYGSRAATLLDGGGTAGRPVRFGRELAQWTTPFGIGYPCHAALEMRRRVELAGATREQFAQVALMSRQYATRNEAAVYREPLDLDQYLAARAISDPVCIYDCDVPVDGSVAVVVSRADRVPDPTRAVRFEALGSASGFDEAAAMMWERTDLRPWDVDIAQVYDGFSVYALRWLEALGFCARYEGTEFVDGGTRIGPDGELPLNTGGGQLSGGRMHGYGGLLEACQQLRGEAGAHQLPSAPQVAVVTSGAETFTSSLLLGAPR
jgi:acetyl-CoA acetyltransferase/uncharacterized OB-fold protein